MRKQGAILLGNGGDNSNGSQGTFYEGAMTAAGTFPSDATDQRCRPTSWPPSYDVQRLSLAPASAIGCSAGTPDVLTRVLAGHDRDVHEYHRGARDERQVEHLRAHGVDFRGDGHHQDLRDASPVRSRPGASVSATFKVTAGRSAFNGDLVGNASWTNSTNGRTQSETAAEKVRNVSPVKINEFRISSGPPANATNSFIELYNAGDSDVDISNWTLTEHPTQQPIFSSVKIPAGTKLAANGFYLLGLSNSGLAVPAQAGDTTIYVRSTTA